MHTTFVQWLGKILGQDEPSVRRLITDPTGLHFLMVWSLFESKCCGGEFEVTKHCSGFAMPKTNDEETRAILEQVRHFHQRYQSQSNVDALAPIAKSSKKARQAFITVLANPEASLSNGQTQMIAVFVASRIRNNMFHGQKGIDDWLRDKDLILRCMQVLQIFVAAQERERPTLTAEIQSGAA
jgi:hypothetical protein